MTTLLQDFRFAVRLLKRNAGFTSIAVLALALGIGANTAIFSLFHAVLLRSLPFPASHRLAVIWEDASAIGFPRNTPAPGNYAGWRARNRTFEDIAALTNGSVNLTGDGEPEQLPVRSVTANFFPVLGVSPMLGRIFRPEEDVPGGPRVCILSYGLWQDRFAGDTAIVGRPIRLNDEPVTVIGVMPKWFQFLRSDSRLWLPVRFSPETLRQYGNHYLNVVGRLKPGVTMDQANADIAAITQQLARETTGGPRDLKALVVSLREQMAGQVRTVFLVLLAAVGCVLLIACVNVANLLLARGAARSREFGLRAALGAGRGRLFRQLMTENLLLAGMASASGIVLASWSMRFLQRLVPEGMALSATLQLDRTVLLYTVLVTAATGLIFGMAPAWHALRLDLNDTLKQGGGRSISGARSGLRGMLVAGEVALSLVLLVGAGLLIQTVARLRGLDLGFQPDHRLTLRTVLGPKYAEPARVVAFSDEVLRRTRSLPGVIDAAYTTGTPLTMKGNTNGFSVEGRVQQWNQDATHRKVSPAYFATLGIPIRRGRAFTESDGPQSLPVAMVNETMARAFWPNEDAVGKRFKIGGPASPNPWLTIVGIAGDVRQMGLEAPVKPEMYFPIRQMSTRGFAPRDLILHTRGDPASLARAVRAEIAAVDPNQPVSAVQTLEQIVESETDSRRLQMLLLSGFAGLALLLAGIGIYGVLSYAVAQRTAEIGVRMALGAERARILGMVLGSGLKLAAAGVLGGAAAAYGLTRLIAGILFGVRPTDPITFAAACALLLAVAALASVVPALRAVRVDPLSALRSE